MNNARWLAVLVVLAFASSLQAASPDRTVHGAAIVLNEIMAVPVQRIPEALLADAEAVAVFPSVVKGGFVAGVERGHGVVTVRQEDRNWGAPRFVTITGGSVGWQIGASATDLILVFKTRKSVENLLNGKFKIGADIAAAAGPVGRRVEAATDGQLQAEIYSYSRSRGLFAGASIDGAVIGIDSDAEAEYYRAGLDGKAIVPESAVEWVSVVDKYSKSSKIPVDAAVVVSNPAAASVTNLDPREAMRLELVQSADQLGAVLDASWKRFLSLPADVFAENGKPSLTTMKAAADRYEQIARDPRYGALAKRAEFQRVRTNVQRYLGTIEAEENSLLQLPPPPDSPRVLSPR